MPNFLGKVPSKVKDIALILLVIVLIYSGARYFLYSMMGVSSNSMMVRSEPASDMYMGYSGGVAKTGSQSLSYSTSAPVSTEYFGNADRKFQTDTSFSILVKNVRTTIDALEAKVKSVGGFVVSKSVNTPESLENGYVTVRVPNEKLDEFKKSIGENSVRIVNESTYGNDITDQYINTEERLATYEATKKIYQDLLTKTSDFNEILQAQNMIIQTQGYIDSLVGQKKYLEGISSTTLINISLSTDEYELSYTPEKSFRPEVVFKLAVRSLVTTLRGVATAAIWIGVYALVFVPALWLLWIVWKFLRNRFWGQNRQ